MYKCTDCGQEYEIKPEYCDCGNNTFEHLEIEKPKQQETQTTFTTKEPERTIYKPRFDVPSLLIFFTCIILSILSIIFIGEGDKDVKVTEQSQKKTVQTTEIPSFDSIWKESKRAFQPVQTAQQVPTPVKKQPIKQIIQKVTKQPVKQQATTQAKPAKSTQQLTDKQKQDLVNKLTNTKPQTTVTPAKKEIKVDPAAERRELNSYKDALRDRLGKSINFARVIGDGNCAITLKIDSSGNLVNRSFSVQSPNNSLNDVVYSAMMNNPTFKTPPSGYKGETLTLNVQIYSGNFEVSLK